MSSEALRGVCVVYTGTCVCIQVNSNDSRTLYKQSQHKYKECLYVSYSVSRKKTKRVYAAKREWLTVY